MPLEIDPKWEYWTPNEEIEELFECPKSISKFDLLEDTGFDEEEKEKNPGFRFGNGNPNKTYFKLKKEKLKLEKKVSYLKTCKCGRLFPNIGKTRYCCQQCRSLFSRPKRKDNCLFCGKSFFAGHSTQRFCSKKCYAESMMKLSFDEGCLNCGNLIPPSKSHNQKQIRKFCCKFCKDQFSKRKERRRKDRERKIRSLLIIDSCWKGWNYIR